MQKQITLFPISIFVFEMPKHNNSRNVVKYRPNTKICSHKSDRCYFIINNIKLTGPYYQSVACSLAYSLFVINLVPQRRYRQTDI